MKPLLFALLLLATPAQAVPITEHVPITLHVPITVHVEATAYVPVEPWPTVPIWISEPVVTLPVSGGDVPLEHSPEPATILLVGTALAALGWRVRRGR